MYAVIEAGGQQFRVSPGDTIKVQRMRGNAGDAVTFERVLLVGGEEKVVIGRPYIESATVHAEVVGTAKERKVLVFKKKPRKGFKRLRGHRQPMTKIMIKDIVVGG